MADSDAGATLQEILWAAQVGTWEWRVQSNEVLWSDNIEALFGLVRGAFARTYEAWMELVHPDDRTWMGEKVAEALRSRLGYEAEFRIVRPDGTLRWQGTRAAVVLTAEGEVEAIRGVVQDITARKTAELETDRLLRELLRAREETELERQRLHGLLVAAPANIAILRGPDFVYELSSRMNDEMAGMALTGQRVADVLTAVEAAGLTEMLQHVWSTGQQQEFRETPVLISMPNGGSRTRYLNGFFQATRNNAGEIDGIAHFAFEVTDQVLARKSLEESERRLAEAVRVRDDFLSIASHELKTPLTPLKLRLDALERDAQRLPDSSLAPAVIRSVSTGRKQLEKLSTLIGDLLDVARISSGRLALQKEESDLTAIVHEIANRYEAAAAEMGSRLSVRAASSVKGIWDRQRLEQVVTNLIDNAIKYGKGAPIQVVLTSDQTYAHLSVIDGGIGISPEACTRIFERFERAVSDRNYGGLGLGLYISRSILEMMDGSISVESVPGQGSHFRVALPLRADPRS